MKKVYLNRIILTLIFIQVFSLFFSCVKPDGREPSSGQTAADASGTPLSGDKKEDAEKVSGQNISSVAVVSETRGTDFLLFSEFKPDAVIAEDFEIGSLQSGFGNDEITADIFSTADSFLKSLTGGEADAELIASEKKSFVRRIVNDGLKISVPSGYRIGEINTMSQPARAGVKLLGEEGWSTGVIYFVREGGWKVYDFHLDFDELERSVEPVIEDWDPANRLLIRG